MISFEDRKRGQEFLNAIARGDSGMLQGYYEWLKNPITQAMMVQLEAARERSSHPQPAPDGLSRAVSLVEAGARTAVWDGVYNLLADFPRYVEEITPAGGDPDVSARPDTL